MLITSRLIERIKANKLIDIIQERGFEGVKKGKNYAIRCPFHADDTNPSLLINPDLNLWNCFGCPPDNHGRTGGDVIKLVMKLDNLSFRQAVRKLAKRNGKGQLESPPPQRLADLTDPQVKVTESPSLLPVRERTQTGNPLNLLQETINFYHSTFLEDKRALNYLANRGIKGEEIYNGFQLGFANGSLRNTLPEDGPLIATLKSLGILNERGREHFYNCVIFPITDENGSVVGLYGRNIEKSSHLYLKGPHRGVFNWQAARAHKEIILTEGIIDALSLYVLGQRNVIPLYGTNGLTEAHLHLFEKERVRRIYLCLDNDEAGKKAQEGLIKRLSLLGMETLTIQLPEDCQDANDYLQKRAEDCPFKTFLEEAESKTIDGILPQEGYPKITQDDDNIFVTFPEREYRVRGLSTQRFDRMRVNIKISDKENYHLDTLDLYCARARKTFINQTKKLLQTEPGNLEQELTILVDELERIQSSSLEKKKEQEREAKEMTEEEKEKALSFLKDKKLLDKIILDMETLGYVGEEANKALGYLVAISRKLNDPLSAIIMSQSSAGKSALAEALEKLTPPEECILYSRITPQALYYMDRDALKRKLLIIEERSGAESADYSIRTLQSRQKLTQAVPIKDPHTGRIRTHSFEVEGPVSYIETTTKPSLNHENSTRCFELYLDESVEQTKRIQQAQKEGKTLKGWEKKRKEEELVHLHHNAQRLLRRIKVINPYAERISFPPQWLRTRRDHLRFLNLIEAVTFLHQYQREIKITPEGTEYIQSTPEDYELAYKLARDVLGESLSELKKPQRELLQTIEAVLKDSHNDASLTRRQIRELSGLPDHRVRSLLYDLIELEYLLAAEGRNGKRYQYKLAEKAAGKKILEGLTTPQELKVSLTS